MRKTFLSIVAFFAIAFPNASYAQDGYELADSTAGNSLDETLDIKTVVQQQVENERHYESIWKKNTFFNISLNSSTLHSDELPTVGGVYSDEYDSSFGIGLQWGHTYNFHRKPLGDVVFIGLDYSWLDVNLNEFKESETPAAYAMGEKSPYNLPWYNKKTFLDFGMSIGPSLTLYPFTSLHKKGTDNIRLQLYYHIGYSFGLAFISDVPKVDGDEEGKLFGETRHGYPSGLFTGFGFNLTWRFIGLGYEARTISKNTVKISGAYNTGKVKFKNTTNRFYLQLRF